MRTNQHTYAIMRVNIVIIYVIIQHRNYMVVYVPTSIDVAEKYKNETQSTFMFFKIVDHSHKLFALVAVSVL